MIQMTGKIFFLTLTLGLVGCQPQSNLSWSTSKISGSKNPIVDFKTPLPAIQQSEFKVHAKALLRGAYDNLNPILMKDGLRTLGFIPLTQPYSSISRFAHHTGSETVDSSVLTATGDSAVVDWILLELRSSSDVTLPVASRAALLLRNGSIVDTDGVSDVSFKGLDEGDYHLAIRHRNHLGYMSPVHSLVNGETLDYDSTSPSVQAYGTTSLIMNIGVSPKRLLISGDANQDGQVDGLNSSAVAGSDKEAVATEISNLTTGYSPGDTNLSGATNAADTSLVSASVNLVTGSPLSIINEEIP